MKRIFLYLPLLLLATLFAGCSNEDDEDIQGLPAIYEFCTRLDIYNADGTAHDITPQTERKITVCAINPDNEIIGLSGTESPIECKGNSIYVCALYMSNQYGEFWNNIPFTITLNSPELFGDGEDRSISLACDGDRFTSEDLELRYPADYVTDPNKRYPDDYVTKVASSDMSISCDRKFVEDDFDPFEVGKVLPIRITLDYGPANPVDK